FSQVVNNNGATNNIRPGLFVNVRGSVINNGSGTITNDGTLIVRDDLVNNATTQGNGTYRISGNWENNNLFIAGSSSVNLEGADQLIAGTTQSDFNDLRLMGTGIKRLGLDASTSGILALKDRELATDANTFFVKNTNTNAVTRTTGYVSNQGVGRLSRQTAANSVYLFPLGSSVGTPRYRPVEITPALSAANTFAVGLFNHDASFDGYDVGMMTFDICAVNQFYYWKINQPLGTDAANISLYFDEVQDDQYTGIANWQSAQWNSLAGVSLTTGGLSRLTIFNWSDFSFEPYAITKDICLIIPPVVSTQFFIYNTFTPDDNGINDTWQIDNIDQYPNNEVKIFNRWGGLVYEAAPYQNDWDGTFDGEKLPVTAYYYVLSLGNGTPAYTGTVNLTR
ncbi:MAG: gliding motility-associated C-terminal domain-containing protein, partial [Flavobacteriales bacterium]|nr:gliding motility-associated C-terminal domain-containing protein [Flavobacteriales bacterium]